MESPHLRCERFVLSPGAIPFVIGGGVAPTLCVGCTLYMLDACTLLSSYFLY